jgi:hypothetical protein
MERGADAEASREARVVVPYWGLSGLRSFFLTRAKLIKLRAMNSHDPHPHDPQRDLRAIDTRIARLEKRARTILTLAALTLALVGFLLLKAAGWL